MEPVDAARILRLVALDFDVGLEPPKAPVLVRIDADTLALLARILIYNASLHGHGARASLSAGGVLSFTSAGPTVAPKISPRLTQRSDRA